MSKLTNRQKVVQELLTNGPASRETLSKRLGIPYSVLRHSLNHARDIGEVRSMIDPNTGRPYKPAIWEASETTFERAVPALKPYTLRYNIYEYLKDENLTSRQLAEALGKRVAAISDTLNWLRKNGFVRVSHTKRYPGIAAPIRVWTTGSEEDFTKRSKRQKEKEKTKSKKAPLIDYEELKKCPINRFNMRAMTPQETTQ